MTDIVERLRAHLDFPDYRGTQRSDPLCQEAADVIETMRTDAVHADLQRRYLLERVEKLTTENNDLRSRIEAMKPHMPFAGAPPWFDDDDGCPND